MYVFSQFTEMHSAGSSQEQQNCEHNSEGNRTNEPECLQYCLQLNVVIYISIRLCDMKFVESVLTELQKSPVLYFKYRFSPNFQIYFSNVCYDHTQCM